MRSLGRLSSFWLALVTSHFLASPSQVASHFLASPSQVASHFFASPSQVTSHKNSDSSPTRVQVAWLESTPLVKSEGMSNTLFTMELTSNSFTKMSDFEVYRLPWLPYMRDTFEFGICWKYSLRPFKWGITWAGLRIHHFWGIKCVNFLENPKMMRLQNVSLLLWKPDRIILISHVVQIQDMCDYQTTCKKWRNF